MYGLLPMIGASFFFILLIIAHFEEYQWRIAAFVSVFFASGAGYLGHYIVGQESVAVGFAVLAISLGVMAGWGLGNRLCAALSLLAVAVAEPSNFLFGLYC